MKKNSIIIGNERGQVMMFGMFVMLLMFLFIGMIFNTGIVIIQKLQMQNAADAAALSGAVVQARGLTWMAYENEDIANLYLDANWECLTYGLFDDKDDAKQYIEDNYSYEIQDHLNNIEYINITYPDRAKDLARRVALKNVPGSVSFTPIMPGHNQYRLTDYEVEEHRVYFFYKKWGWLPWLGSDEIETFVKKDRNTTTYFAVKLTGLGADSSQLMSGAWFGSIPEITTYAAAKPYGGWLLSPIQIESDFSLFGFEIDFSYPIWIDWELPILGNFINMKKHSAYLVRIGDNRLKPRPTAIPNYNKFEH